MVDTSIKNLHAALDARYGARVRPYGSTRDEEHGFGFAIDGILATFSVITLEGTLPINHLDIQVESLPPGDYIHTDQIQLEELMALIERFAGPMDQWP